MAARVVVVVADAWRWQCAAMRPSNAACLIAGPSGCRSRQRGRTGLATGLGRRRWCCSTPRAAPARPSRSRRRCGSLRAARRCSVHGSSRTSRAAWPRFGRIVCSVPPQHMFGVEARSCCRWCTAIAVLDRRPLLPADVRAAFADGAPAAWIATPLHLRAWCSRRAPAATAASSSPRRCRSAPALGARDESSRSARRCWRSTVRPRPACWRCGAPRARPPGARATACARVRRDAHRGRRRALPVAAAAARPVELDADGRFTLLGRQSRPDQDRRATRLAGRAQPAAAGTARPRGRRVLPAARQAPTERLC